MKRNNRAKRREAKRAEDAARLHAARAEVRAEWSRRARESVERRMAELVRQLGAEPLKIGVGSGRFVGDVTGDRIITEAIAAPSFSLGRMNPLSEVVYSTAIREDKMLRLPNGTVIWWVGWRDGSKPSPCRHVSPYNTESGMRGVDWTVTCFLCLAQRRTVLTRSGEFAEGDWIPVPTGETP